MKKEKSLVNKSMMKRAIKDSFIKLNPRVQIQNPVMFIVYMASILSSILYIISLFGIKDNSPNFILGIAILLWFTVIFANFAEAIAEGRGKAQADSLRASKKDVVASKIASITDKSKVTKVSYDPGESFMDKMIAMVEGAARKKTPNEIALQILLVALTIIFLTVTVSLYSYSKFSFLQAGVENNTSVTVLLALLVCLAPTTIGALLSAIGIAGMSRLNQANVLAMSGRAIEAAGDVDILMLDKTGTITLGNRQASEFVPVDGIDK